MNFFLFPSLCKQSGVDALFGKHPDSAAVQLLTADDRKAGSGFFWQTALFYSFTGLLRPGNKYSPFSASFFTLAFILLFSAKVHSALCTATVSGAWNNNSTWSCGSVPNCGDSVVIPIGKTVTVTVQQDYTGCGMPLKITVIGDLKFDNGNKLKLPCNSKIYIYPGASILPGGGGGNSNYIDICNITLWTAGLGELPGPSCLPLTPACMGQILPISLSSFTATAGGSEISLKWSTAQEKNSSHFEVERSTDVLNFSRINTVNSKAQGGNSYALLSYSCLDSSPFPGSSYYRLKQVDLDNSYAYSQVITVSVFKTDNIKFVIYPNSNNGEFTADISGIENNYHAKILLSDRTGSVVYHKELFLQEASKINIAPEQRLAKGIYICTLIIGEMPFKVKVVVD